MPLPKMPRLDADDFASPETVGVDVILTFENSPQRFYQTEVIVDVANTDFDATEIDVVAQILDDASCDMSDLVKISLCYEPVSIAEPSRDRRMDELLEHLNRFSAKYYFQPDQRDPHEQAIVDALGVASRTTSVGAPVPMLKPIVHQVDRATVEAALSGMSYDTRATDMRLDTEARALSMGFPPTG